MVTRQSSKARLTLQQRPQSLPGGQSRVVTIDHLPFTLGRGSERDLCIPSPEISRAHALIDRDGDGYFVRDTGSRHGTFVNGMRITTTRLRSSDQIALGTPEHTLLFEVAEPDNSTKTLLAQFTQTSMPSRQTPSTSSDLDTLALFLKAAQSLYQHGARADVLSTMLEYTIRLTGAERGFVFLGNSAETLIFECGQEKDGTPIATPTLVSNSVLRDAAKSKLAFLFSDSVEQAVEHRDSLILSAIRNVVAIPLRRQNSSQLLGLLYLDSRAATHDFTRTRRDILEAIASQATTLFENLRMLDAEREFVLLRKELEIAATIQRQIIPQNLPEFPYVRLGARTIPCTGIGGDFYDVIPVAGGFAAIVGDVCGKGVPAALLGAMAQGMFHAQMTSGASLVDAVQCLNSFIVDRAPGEKYVTLAAVRYSASDAGNAQIELVNGGHVSPMVVRAGGQVETITDGDPPVGLFGFVRFHTVPIQLATGDRILLLTDGITEAEDLHGTQFGAAQMDAYLRDPNAVEAMFTALEQFCMGTRPQDDQTILTIDRV
ncbi:MAG TPA: SpoIIE family protein phosphatase [Terracidiphilus sp.]|jgi:serine phosphatase RsbU (regulator of sigma subunit)/pSer/pThr/pTyr-binding forkhead associated (FHA) protein